MLIFKNYWSKLLLYCTIILNFNGVRKFVSATMHCLVSRPGYGLVSEECPRGTVACRIRIENSAVDFYQYSPLYDRNQFVCVMKNEYGNEDLSGCVRKRTGHIRCWCFGRSNCNTPEASKQIYSAFVANDSAKFHDQVEKIDFADIFSNSDAEKNKAVQFGAKNYATGSHTDSSENNRPILDVDQTGFTEKETKVIIKSENDDTKISSKLLASKLKTMRKSNSNSASREDAITEADDLEESSKQFSLSNSKTDISSPNLLRSEDQKTTTATTNFEEMDSPVLNNNINVEEEQDKGPSTIPHNLPQTHKSNGKYKFKPTLTTLKTTTTTTTEVTTTKRSLKNKMHHKISKIENSQRKHSFDEQNVGVDDENEKKQQKHSKKTSDKKNLKNHKKKEKTFLSPATKIRSEFDAENRVHVIHVSAKDRYDQLIASPEFSGIIRKYSKEGNEVAVPELAEKPSTLKSSKNMNNVKNHRVDKDHDNYNFDDDYEEEQGNMNSNESDDDAFAELELNHFYDNNYKNRARYFNTQKALNSGKDTSLEVNKMSKGEMRNVLSKAAFRTRNNRDEKDGDALDAAELDAGYEILGKPEKAISAQNFNEYFDNVFYTSAANLKLFPVKLLTLSFIFVTPLFFIGQF